MSDEPDQSTSFRSLLLTFMVLLRTVLQHIKTRRFRLLVRTIKRRVFLATVAQARRAAARALDDAGGLHANDGYRRD
ncbi:MAG: hypothetical protein AAF890_07815 [Pseudomonadota bacterium]